MTDAIDNEIERLEGRLDKMRRLLDLRMQTSNVELRLTTAPRKEENIRAIELAVCNHFDVSMADVYSDSRQADLSLARHAIFFFIRRLLNDTYSSIGRRYNRDHAAVMHGTRRIESMIKREPKFLAQILDIESACKTKFKIVQ